ncbi:MAG: DUF748 domain-containing protein [Pontibacterium sp.]
MLRALLLLLVFLGLVAHTAPFVVRDYLVGWLRDQGVEQAQLYKLAVNPFTGRITIDRLLAKSAEHPELSINYLAIDLDLQALWSQRVLVSSIHLHGVKGAWVDQNGQAFLGPLNLNNLSSNEPSPEPDSETTKAPASPWQVGIETVSISQVDWQAKQNARDYLVHIDLLTVGSLRQWQLKQSTPISLKGTLNNAPFSLDMRLTPDMSALAADGTLAVKNLSLASLLVPEGINAKGQVDGDIKFTLVPKYAADSQTSEQSKPQSWSISQQSQYSARGLAYSQDAINLQLPSLSITSDATIDLATDDLTRITGLANITRLDNALDISATGTNVELDGQKISHDNATLSTQISLSPTSLENTQGATAWKVDQKNQITVKGLVFEASDLTAKVVKASISDQSQAQLALSQNNGEEASELSGNPLITDIQGAVALGGEGLTIAAPDAVIGLNTLQLNTQLNLADVQQIPTLHDLKLALTGLAAKSKEADAALGRLNINASEINWPHRIASEKIQAAELSAALPSKQVLKLQGINLDDTVVKPINNAETITPESARISVNSLSLDGLEAYKAQQLLTSLQSLNVQGISASTQPQNQSAGLGKLALTNLHVEGEVAPVLALKALNLGQSSVMLPTQKSHHAGQLNLGKLSLDQLDVLARLKKGHKPADIDWLMTQFGLAEPDQNTEAASTLPLAEHSKQSSNDNNTKQAPKPSPQDENTPQMGLQLAGVVLNNAKIRLSDTGMHQAYEGQIDITRAEVGAVMRPSQGLTPFLLKGDINEGSPLELNGVIDAFGKAYNGQWQATLTALNLPTLSPYMETYTGYYLDGGKLTILAKGEIKDDVMASQNNFKISRLGVERADPERIKAVSKTLNMPLETAIMILENDDKLIDLDIPIDGAIDDLNFGYQSIINDLAGKGLRNAAMGFLTRSLQPYAALVSIARSAVEASQSGAFITLNPIPFAVGSAQLDKDGTAYLSKLSTMLKDRSGMHLSYCGRTVAADRTAITQRATEENLKRPQPLQPEALNALIEEQMTSLANQRTRAVGEHLAQAVSQEQLSTCYARFDNKSDTPRVDLSL